MLYKRDVCRLVTAAMHRRQEQIVLTSLIWRTTSAPPSYLICELYMSMATLGLMVVTEDCSLYFHHRPAFPLTPPAMSNFNNKPTSTAVLYDNLQLVKDKLACYQHPGEGQWCWVNPRIPNAEHLPLCLHDIQLWATYLVRNPFPYFICSGS